MVRPVLTLPKDRALLRQRSTKIKAFDEETMALAQDLVDTWAKANAYGISAPQIGVPRRAMLFRNEEGLPVVVVNPKILSAKGEEKEYDGCLSIPGIYGRTRRAFEIEITGQRPDGTRFRQHLAGITARIAQHELDHLDGVLFIDRVDTPDDLYTIGKVETDDGEESQELPLTESERRFVEREMRPLPGYALTTSGR